MENRYRRNAQHEEYGDREEAVDYAFMISEKNEFLRELQYVFNEIVEDALTTHLKDWLYAKWPGLVDSIVYEMRIRDEALTPEDEDAFRSMADGYVEAALEQVVSETREDLQERDSSYAVDDVLEQLRREFIDFLSNQ